MRDYLPLRASWSSWCEIMCGTFLVSFPFFFCLPILCSASPGATLLLLFFFFLIFFPFIFISWRLITLQDCSGFCHALTWVSHGFTMYSPSWSPLPPPSPPHPSGSSQCTRPEHLSHASNLGWWSVSPLIVYLFQEYFLNISLALKFLTWKFFLEKKHQCLISAIFSILEWKLSIWKWINSVKQWCYGFMKCSTSIFY